LKKYNFKNMQKLASVEEQNSRKKGRDEEAITPPQVEQSPVENLAAQAEKTAPTPENAKGMVKDASSAAQAESLATQGQIAETSTAIEQLASAGKVSPESAAEAVAAETQLAKQEEQMSAELAGAFDFLDDAIDSVSAKSPPTPKTKRAETVKTKPTAERMVTRPGKYGEEKFWNIISNYGIKFWTDMPWMSDGRQLWKYIISTFSKINILSSVPEDDTAHSRQGKIVWCKRNLGNVNVILEKNKYRYVSKNSILIDDLEKNINPWVSSGGIGILHKSTGNTISKLEK